MGMHGLPDRVADKQRGLHSIACTLLVFSLVLALTALSPNAAASEPLGTAYIAPTGAGSRDGSSWENAGNLSQLPILLARAGPGGRVLLRADMGAYQTSSSIDLHNGGLPGRPITVTGVDRSGHPMKAVIAGTRADPYSPTGAPGSELFRLLRGADHLSFNYLSFHNQGNGCFRLGADIHDLTIEHVDAVNVRRFVENTAAGSAKSASVDGLIIRDVKVNGFSKGAVRLQYDTRNVLLEDIDGDSERQDGDNFAEGVNLEGTVHDVVLRRVIMRNSRDTLHKYWNGDGFTTEQQTYRIRFENTVATGSTDAGYDIKSSGITLDNAVAAENKHNFKLWGDGVLISNCIGRSPHRRGGTGVQDQFEIVQGANVTITGCHLTDADPLTTVFHLERDAHVRVRSTHILKDDDAKMSLIEEGASLTIE